MCDGAQSLSTLNDSKQQVAKGGLIDLSVLSRCGGRGPNIGAWLNKENLPVPAVPNQAMQTASGQTVLRLSKTEYWLLSNPLLPDEAVADIYTAGEGCYSVYCEDGRSWFVLTGETKTDVMAKVCGVDLREVNFPVGAVVQTAFARVNGVILHHAIGKNKVFSIFSDSASAEYLWLSLLDAMSEFGGAEIGLSMLLE
tara:strand:- start:42746 stop:43336 length:591 start_codon:yes stop_codon:yes gene_type:complete